MTTGKAVLVYAGIVVTYLLGSDLEALLALVVVVALDGLLVAAVARDTGQPAELSLGRFLLRKSAYVGLIALANLLDRGLGTDPPILATTAIWVLIVAEAALCLRHLAVLGVPIPDNVRAAVELLQGRAEEQARARVDDEGRNGTG